MTKFCAALLIGVLSWTATASAQTGAVEAASIWRARAEKMPIGSTVKLRLQDGERLTAALIHVDHDGLTLKPNTRMPTPSRRVPFDAIAKLDRHVDHVSFGKYAAIGAAI